MGGNVISTRPNRKRVAQMGAYLKARRHTLGHCQDDVAAAIGKTRQYVSETERGARGTFMDTLTAYTWAHYLQVEPMRLLNFLGHEGANGELKGMIDHMSTIMWARRLMQTQNVLKELAIEVDAAGASTQNPHEKQRFTKWRHKIQDMLALVSAPQTGRNGREKYSAKTA